MNIQTSDVVQDLSTLLDMINMYFEVNYNSCILVFDTIGIWKFISKQKHL